MALWLSRRTAGWFVPPSPAELAQTLRPGGGSWDFREVSANGVRLHVTVTEPGSAPEPGSACTPAPAPSPTRAAPPTLLLLHGFPFFWRIWETLIPPLAAAGYRVIAPDQRGCGGSDKPPTGYALAMLAQDTLSLCRALGATSNNPFTLVGHGLGGALAWAVPNLARAQGQPGLFNQIITICAPHPLATRSLPFRWASGAGGQLASLQIPWLAEQSLMHETSMRSLLTSWVPPQNRDAVARIAGLYALALRQPFAASSTLAPLRANLRIRGENRLPLTSAPPVAVTSICGALDPVTPSQAFARDAHFAAGTLHQIMMRNTGHLPMVEKPDDLLAHLLTELGTIR